MKMPIRTSIVFALLLLAGLGDLSAQNFFPNKIPGTFQVRFLPPVGGLVVQVSIDGQLVGTLPATVWVRPGVHQFSFTAPGEAPKTVSYTVKNDTVVPSLFTAPTYPLTVNTNVPGAALSIDGQPFAGNSTALTPGNHTLTVNAPGYQSVTMPFNQPASPHVLNVTLVSNTFPLTVNTNVPGASMAIDGQPMAGNATSISAGNHTLTVSAPGYQTLTVPFTQPNKANVLNLTLVSNTFPLTVNTNVPGAALSIDGQPFAGNTTSATPGNHTLVVMAPGYQTLTIPFSQPAKAHVLTVTLIAIPGSLQVNTDRLFPAGTPYKLFINGGEVRGGTQSLSPGSYNVRITSGALSLETTITVTSGQNLTLTPSIQWDLR